MKTETFYFELTDTYGGQLNYCSIERFKVQARTLHGALCKISTYTGLNFTHTNNRSIMFEFDGWVSKSGCTGLYEPDYYQDEIALNAIYNFTEL